MNRTIMNRVSIICHVFILISILCLLYYYRVEKQKNDSLWRDNLELRGELLKYSELSEGQGKLLKRQAILIEGMLDEMTEMRERL